MKLVVGLGNPGSQYAGTRHNVGFEVIDQLAARLGWCGEGQFDRQAKSNFGGLTIGGSIDLQSRDEHRGGLEKVVLLKPMQYMNVSGRSVQAASAFYQLAPSDLIVVLDDLALPCGTIRIRGAGSSGGHNGLKDIERALGTGEYARLRLGIDPTPPPMAGKDYVLGKFSAEQRQRLDPAISRACGAIVTWIDHGTERAMAQFNGDAVRGP